MLQVYNYLLESYPIKREVMYPAHKRSELKKVYNSIVNLSKSSPLYKINLSKENQDYTIGIKETALQLKSKLEGMSLPENSGFDTKTIAVSDEKVLSAQLLSDNTEGLPETITFHVDAKASIQINVGKELMHASKGLSPGAYDFKAKVMDQTYDLTYNQETRIENQETLKDMANFLNNSISGINASVDKGSSSDYSRIVIMSEQAGKNGEPAMTFSDSDHYNTGVVEYFGLDRVEKESNAAQFTLNGVEKQTSTNTFNVENKLRVTLRGTSEEPVSLKIVPDSTKILSAVDSVLRTYNSLIKIAQNRTADNKEHYRATKLLGELKSLESVYSEELDSCGLKANEKGFLAIDDSLAIQASQDGGMESLFTRENGFITRLIDKAESIAINPMEYLDKTIVTYPNTEANTYRNPYVTSMYSGLFFSSYC